MKNNTSNTLNQYNFTQSQLVILQPFFDLETWEERYEYLMDLGEKLPQMPENFKTPNKRILGCQSRVWLEINFLNSSKNSKIIKSEIKLESDALIVRGFLLIIKILFQDKTPQEIINFHPDIPKIIGLEKKISITRLTGVSSVVEAIHNSAKNHI